MAMMIDLSAMRGVLVDPERRLARVGGGALLGDMDMATQRHGLATPAGVISHTGVGGYTLGGGYGRLSRKYGLAIDNLVSAELVTADGKVRRVSAEQDADLFWAIRGGGGNFGVATEFEFRLHDIGQMVLAGQVAWPADQARDVLEFFAERSTDLPDELDAGPGMLPFPEGVGQVSLAFCYFGDLDQGAKVLAPFREFGRPMEDSIGPAPYLAVQTGGDALFRSGIRSYVKSGMVKEISQELIDALAESYDPRRGIAIGSHAADGAMSRVGETDTAWPHRNARTMIGAFSVWWDPGDDEGLIKANREQWAALSPHMGGYYENIQSESDGVPQNFGPVYERLVEVKTRHDPMNLFRLNSNIRPRG